MEESYDHIGSMSRLIDDPLVERDWLKPVELAKRLNVHETSIRNWVRWGWIFANMVPSISGHSGVEHYQIPIEEVHKIERFTHQHSDELMKFVPRTIKKAGK